MKLFICWSGLLSNKIALVLRDWIPAVIPPITPWVSSEDIRKGTRWQPEVAKGLADSFFGIACIVPDNIKEPWLPFEAGALSKSVGESRVFPILFAVEPSQLPEPLAQFQATVFEKEDIRKLMHSLNEILGQQSIPQDQLNRVFEYSWPGLQEGLDPLLKGLLDSPVDAPRGDRVPIVTPDHAEDEIIPEPPPWIRHIKWLLLRWRDPKILVLVLLFAIITVGGALLIDHLKQMRIFPTANKKSSMDSLPDVSQAKREVLIVSRNQFVDKPELEDVSKSVPGYFEFTVPPAPGRDFSWSCAETQSAFSANYFASARIAGLNGAVTLELKGLGVYFAINASDAMYFVYESEENWTNWQPLKVGRERSINALAVYQIGREVRGFLNGNYVTSFSKLKKAEPGSIGVCFKADPKRGGRIHFQKLSIWELGN